MAGSASDQAAASSNEVRPVVDAILERFEALNAARDRALADGRRITRLAANTIRSLHRGDHDEAGRLITQAGSMVRDLAHITAPYPALYWAGYVQDAMKEYAEARVTAAVLRGEALPPPDELAVEDAAYLNALAEAASELRRDVLDGLRRGELVAAEDLLGRMDEIYSALLSVDFPDAVTGGLRRSTDQLRGVLERTRGDVTVAARQHHLEQALQRAEASLKSREA